MISFQQRMSEFDKRSAEQAWCLETTIEEVQDLKRNGYCSSAL